MANFRIGQILKHTVFGEGTIKNIIQKDGKDILTIKFDGEEKTLDPTIATLEIVGEDEFEKIKGEYKEQNDQINLLHIEHNYYWSKAFQYLPNDPTTSLSFIIKALSKLFDRHKLRSYSIDTFENMLGTYEVALIKIGEVGMSINFDVIEEDFLILII